MKDLILAMAEDAERPTGEVDARSSEWARLSFLIARQFAKMERVQAGILADEDPAYLHDFRVAVRRLRTIIAQLDGVLSDRVKSGLQNDLRWLTKRTGPLRDLDVFLDRLPALRSVVPDENAAMLGDLEGRLSLDRALLYRTVARSLQSKRFQSFMSEWPPRFEAGDIALLSGSEDAEKSIGPRLARKIDTHYRRLCRDGARIGPQTPDQALHDLRKRGKKLRYLIELSHVLNVSAGKQQKIEVEKTIRALKKVQDILGRHQDCRMHSATIRDRALRFYDEGAGSVEFYLSLGILMGHLHEDQRTARRNFHKAFHRLTKKRMRKRINGLVKNFAANSG